ncbi:T9SS type A sorting domain-containing protein [uncultured Chryseobacterium sp.]|uniref:T9SS type A sorting domain-containing protein n=1 Tax=uncultured Chryseobacterium sp. TaxID=259322 RepID=UPI0025F3A606|nr:T9SS type A sorting domain-containing protein [uncultured Chryseobacterium sp.]
MKLNYLISLSFAGIFFATVLKAQAPAIEWQRSFGGTADEYASSIIQTADGGFMIAGSSNSNNGNVTGNHGNSDYWLLKLNAMGNLQWQKSLGGTGNDFATSIIQLADGGYTVAGVSSSNNSDVTGNHGNADGWIARLNQDAGILYWQKSFGGTGSDVINSIIPTTDGGYVFAGSSTSINGDVAGNKGYVDYWIVKIDANGNIQWKKSLGGTGDDRAASVVQTSDGGYVVAGYAEGDSGDVTGSHGGKDYWILKLNSDGGVIYWKKSLGGSFQELATSLVKTSDGGFIVAGHSSSNDGDVSGNHDGTDYWVTKLNADGNIQWQKALGGSKQDLASSVIQAADGGYLVLGSASSTDGQVIGHHPASGTLFSYDYWAVKLSPAGNIQWQKCLGGSGIDNAYDVVQTTDGGYVIAGSSDSNNGDVTGNHGSSDVWIVKLAPENNLATDEVMKELSVNIFPNPAKDHITLKLDYFTPAMEATITDVSGRVIHIQKLDGLTTRIGTGHLEKGVYFLHVTGGKNNMAKKFIKE